MTSTDTPIAMAKTSTDIPVVMAKRPRFPMLRRVVITRYLRENPGANESEISEHFDQAMEEAVELHKVSGSDRPFLDWLLNGGGLDKIIQIIMMFLNP